MPFFPRLFMLAVSLLAPALRATDSGAHFRTHLGLQLWSVRTLLKEDAAAALDRVQGWGFTEVETADTARLPPERFLALLRARGLKPIAAHFTSRRLETDLAGAVAEAKALGATYAMCPQYWPEIDGKKGAYDEATARTAAAAFNHWGAAFRAAGLQFGYHPHGFEFAPRAGGETMFDLLARETDPKLVIFELDVFWAFIAGLDPAALLEKYADRWALLHVKDLRSGAPRGTLTGTAPAEDFVACGRGQIDWPGVLQAAQRIGVRHYFIEAESQAPLDEVTASRDYLLGLTLVPTAERR